MWPERVSNPGPLTYESDALPTALRGPAHVQVKVNVSQSLTAVRQWDLESQCILG